MLGYDPATFRETNAAWIERLHPDDRARVAEYYRAYVAGKIPEYRVEFRQRTRGEGWRWILSLGRIVERDTRGEPLRMVGTHTDITELKRADEQLRRTSDHLKALIEVSPLALVTTDAEGTLLSWNPGAQTMFGWTEAEVLEKSFPWVPPGEEADSERIWNQSIQDGGARGLELRRLRKDGSLIDVKLWSAPIRNADGAITHWVAFLDDITELKQAHQNLRRSERQLRTVLDTLPIGVWFTDVRGQVLYGNALAKQVWSDAVRVGLTNQESGKLWWETTSGEDDLPHRWAIGTVMTRGAIRVE